ncbi:hypothetical protein DFP72DRAFT_894990 [Ephemerocybe angulata]|uniref:Uncharacterized protein n=1 Tax=Ephemerocybe angulata TaxID=980116 RepID=A0A8H6M9N7_9AGAR|nr:hypothetical protein DFP72DRAFT_894990 [Tulosesus angulatus]
MTAVRNRPDTAPPTRRPAPRRDTEVEDPLPAYEDNRDRVVPAQGICSYDTPSAFGLATSIATSERGSTIDSSSPLKVTIPANLSLLERMQQTQRMMNALNALTSAAPPGGYPENSLEAMKILQMRRSMVLLMDVSESRASGASAGGSPPPQLTTLREDLPGSGSSAGTTAAPAASAVQFNNHEQESGSLHQRMLEIQHLLSQVDDLVSSETRSSPASNEQIKELRAHIAALMEDPRGNGQDITEEPRLPKPSHHGPGARAELDETAQAPEPGISGPASASGQHQETNGSHNTNTPTPRLPPPYQEAVKTSSDKRAEAGGSKNG